MGARRTSRSSGHPDQAPYGLGGLLACAARGRRLIGHVGRYRHTDACEAFKAAAPRRHRRNAKTNLGHRVKGESYKVEVYEDAVGLAFGHVAVSSALRASTIAAATSTEPDGGDVLAQARIKRERAALQFAKDRDLGRLEATMACLDVEAEAAVVRPSRVCPFHMGNKVHPSESLAAYFPWLAKEWHPTKNHLRPDHVTRASGREVHWICEVGHEWSAVVLLAHVVGVRLARLLPSWQRREGEGWRESTAEGDRRTRRSTSRFVGLGSEPLRLTPEALPFGTCPATGARRSHTALPMRSDRARRSASSRPTSWSVAHDETFSPRGQARHRP